MPAQSKSSASASQSFLLKQLRSSSSIERVKAAQDSGSLFSMSKALSLALEQAALNDKDSSVRYWAQKALNSPGYKAVASQQSLGAKTNKILIQQINQWKKEGLVDDELASVLAARYGQKIALSPSTQTHAVSQEKIAQPRPAPAKAAQPKRSLGEILFSQTTINIALFLGAFFVLAAALILAALNASLRIPILSAVTLVFLGGALGFRKRLPTASLTLFVVYSLLVPILARVIIQTASLQASQRQLFWLLVTVFLTANWAFAAWQYHSRLFALLAFVGFNSLPFQLIAWLDGASQLAMLLATVANLTSMFVVLRVKQQKDRGSFNLLFVLSQVWAFLMLFFILTSLLPGLFSAEPYHLCMLALAGALLVSSVYYHFSHLNSKFTLFPHLAVASLLAIPWIVLRTLGVEQGPTMFITWVWGSAFALVGHSLDVSKKSAFYEYGTPLLLGSGFLSAIAALFVSLGVTGWLPAAWWAFIIYLGIGAVYTYLTIQKRRSLIWGSALLAFYLAYGAFWGLPFMENRSFFIGFLLLWPALAFLSLDLYTSRFFAKEKVLHRWPRVYGAIGIGLAVLALFAEASGEPLRVAIGFAIFASFMVFYTSARRVARFGYFATAATILAASYLLHYLSIENLTFPLLALGGAFYLGGSLLLRQRKVNLWARPLFISGLGLIGILTFSAPGLGGMSQHMILYVLSFVAFLSADLIEHQRKPQTPSYRTFIRLSTVLICAYTLVMSFNRGLVLPLDAGIAFGTYAALFAAYAFSRKIPNVAYLATTAFAVAIAFLLRHFQVDDLTYPLLGLGSVYYLAGYSLFRKRSVAAWGRVIHYSGLALIGLVAFAQYDYAFRQQQLHVSVFAVIAFVLADLAERRRKPINSAYRNPARLATLALGLYSLITIVRYGGDFPLAAAATFAVYAALFLFYALASKAPRVAFLSTAALAAAVFYFESYFGLENWLPGLAALSLVYLALSFVPKGKKQANIEWNFVFERSITALNLIVALAALDYAEGLSIISVALAATIFAVQAFRSRAIGKAVLADFLYLEAYLLALTILDVREPQFYSMGAALLGLVMHYMLTHSHANSAWTFIAGTLSQLVLLSTTYYQMVNTGEFQYFFILFFQSLAVIAYGIVIRSRSLVAVPIGFIILEVVSVIYSRLSGYSTFLIIGCTGVSLLTLAIVALFMRERISDTTERVKARLSTWSV